MLLSDLLMEYNAIANNTNKLEFVALLLCWRSYLERGDGQAADDLQTNFCGLTNQPIRLHQKAKSPIDQTD